MNLGHLRRMASPVMPSCLTTPTHALDQYCMHLTPWGRVIHICVSELTTISPDDGLSPGHRQAIIWTNAGILLIGPLGTNFNEILIEIHTFSFKKMHLKMSSAKWRPFCLGLNVLTRALVTYLMGAGYLLLIVFNATMLGVCPFITH